MKKAIILLSVLIALSYSLVMRSSKLTCDSSISVDIEDCDDEPCTLKEGSKIIIDYTMGPTNLDSAYLHLDFEPFADDITGENYNQKRFQKLRITDKDLCDMFTCPLKAEKTYTLTTNVRSIEKSAEGVLNIVISNEKDSASIATCVKPINLLKTKMDLKLNLKQPEL